MTASVLKLLSDTTLHRRIARGGLQTVHSRFCAEEVVPRYESFYEQVLARNPATVSPA